VPHATRKGCVRKLLRLRCDECGNDFERGWQREVSEQPAHCCSRKCMYLHRGKNVMWRENIKVSTRRRMSEPDVKERMLLGIERSWEKPERKKAFSEACKKKFETNPQLRKNHSERIRLKFKDEKFLAFFKSRLSSRVNPWWKPWMQNDVEGVHWANKIIQMFGHKCARCGSSEKIHAHHIAPKSKHPELKFDLNNGIALCQKCHTGRKNIDSVHKILRNDPERYVLLMKELLEKRVVMIGEDT